jgi:phosphatidylglycerophosphate synthase
MIGKYKQKLNPVILFIARPFKGVDPNILTLLGLIPPILFYYFISIGEYGWALVSMAGVVLDTLDGAVARLSGKESKFGGILDSVLDRISDSIFIAGFAVAGLVSFEIAMFLMVQSATISYIRARAGSENVEVKNGLIERPERLLLIALSLLVYILAPDFLYLEMNLPTWGFMILNVLSLVTIIQRINKSYKLLS